MQQTINARTQFYLDNPNFIISIARKHHIPESDIDDFSQQVLLESLQHRCKRNKKKTLEEYAELYVVMRISAYKRKKRIERHVDMTQFPAKTPSADRVLEWSESWQDLKEQIKANGYSITERQNEVMELLSSGLNNKQAATEMGVSEIRIRCIRRQIRKKIDKTEKKRGRKNKNYNEKGSE